MESNLSHKPDAIIIDRDIKSKIKLSPSVLKFEYGKLPILIVNQKLEDIVTVTKNMDNESTQYEILSGEKGA